MSSSWLSDKRYRRQASAFVTSTTTSTICLRIASRSSWLLIEAEIRCSTSTSRVFSLNACWRYATDGVRVVVIEIYLRARDFRRTRSLPDRRPLDSRLPLPYVLRNHASHTCCSIG